MKKKLNKKKKTQFLPATIYTFFLTVLGFLVVSGVAIFGLQSSPVRDAPDASVLGFNALIYEVPHLNGRATFAPNISARSVYALDVSSGIPLLIVNPKEPLQPASTTKIATALVAMAHYRLDDVLTIEEDFFVSGQSMGLEPGEQITVANLLYGLLVFSGNDAAEVLARNYPGGRQNFIGAMNRLATSLNLASTHFTNPTGLDEALHYSTAQDMATLSLYALENPLFSQIVATKAFTATNLDGDIVHELANINVLLGSVSGVIGVKTGYTIGARESLVTLIERDGHRILISLFGSNDRFRETEALIDWVFESYQW